MGCGTGATVVSSVVVDVVVGGGLPQLARSKSTPAAKGHVARRMINPPSKWWWW
jgi:hypothetical protein